jgi:hypothetical protein
VFQFTPSQLQTPVFEHVPHAKSFAEINKPSIQYKQPQQEEVTGKVEQVQHNPHVFEYATFEPAFGHATITLLVVPALAITICLAKGI